jgi:hypothetical protein
VKTRRWRNRKGWLLSLVWQEKRGGTLTVYNPTTGHVSVLRAYEWWQEDMARNTAELVAQSMGAREVAVKEDKHAA